MPATYDCGHPRDAARIRITTRRFGEVTGGVAPEIASVAGGRRVLVAKPCRTCRYVTYYRQGTIGAESKTLDNERGVVAAALAEVLAEPTDVFTLELSSDRAMNVVIPRHHLPLLIVEAR